MRVASARDICSTCGVAVCLGGLGAAPHEGVPALQHTEAGVAGQNSRQQCSRPIAPAAVHHNSTLLVF
jgi:hypothetical protein